MRVACCCSGPNPIPNTYKEFFKVFDNVKYFYYDDPSKSFERNVEKLALDKQQYELELLQNTHQQHSSFYDVCIYLNTYISFENLNLEFKGCDKNTVYTVSDYTEQQPKVFDMFKQYNVSKDFFYCDSKTFNTIGLYNKFKHMTHDMYAVPQETFFYSFLQSMGIKNRSLIHA
jgi:hypothetical protein|tara:strand:- start:1921 stop:2439 length:519 start_codon:yes stop_codon:yes gene_type:complete